MIYSDKEPIKDVTSKRIMWFLAEEKAKVEKLDRWLEAVCTKLPMLTTTTVKVVRHTWKVG